MRHSNRDGLPLVTLEPLLNDLRLVNNLWQQDLGRHIGSLIIELGDKGGKHAVRILVLGALKHEILAAQQFATPHKKDLDARAAIILRKSDDILIDEIGRDDLLM